MSTVSKGWVSSIEARLTTGFVTNPVTFGTGFVFSFTHKRINPESNSNTYKKCEYSSFSAHFACGISKQLKMRSQFTSFSLVFGTFTVQSEHFMLVLPNIFL